MFGRAQNGRRSQRGCCHGAGGGATGVTSPSLTVKVPLTQKPGHDSFTVSDERSPTAVRTAILGANMLSHSLANHTHYLFIYFFKLNHASKKKKKKETTVERKNIPAASRRRTTAAIQPVFLYPPRCAISVEFSTGYWLSGPPSESLPPPEPIYSGLINIW